MIFGSGDAVLCDFRLSKRLGDELVGMTTSAETFMSFRYAAAEIFCDGRPAMKTSEAFGFITREMDYQACMTSTLRRGVFGLSSSGIAAYFQLPSDGPATPRETRRLQEMDYTGNITYTKFITPGGFSDVWEGMITSTGTKVAIKFLRAAHASISELSLKARMARELYAWCDLQHPRILPLVGFAFVENQPCLLSPWRKNGNVLEYLSGYPGADRKALILEIAGGLMYLHSQKPAVVHSDIKSLNILITDCGHAVLCDFGGSKRLEEESTGMITSGQTCTYRYAPVEVIRGGKPSIKSDVYSFACVALEIITNRAPFCGLKKTAAVIVAISEGRTLIPSDYPALPADHPLWKALHMCLHHDAEQRPTMEEVSRKLANVDAASYMGFWDPKTSEAE